MSNFNYMDDVPVKIAEGFKRLPKVFQIPQAIVNKLQLSPQYYESPQFTYDFQLEKKVLEQIPNWRYMRQRDRKFRRDRKQKREELRMRAIQQQHKQMLGAVFYPDAEELSTDSDTDEEEGHAKNTQMEQVGERNEDLPPTEIRPRLAVNEVGSFYNILKPTILPQSEGRTSGNSRGHSAYHTRNKSSSSFNYKDFEEDTSSPFDNIELKTINDLDILAQVLQHAQVNARDDNDTERQKVQENEFKSSGETGSENMMMSQEDASQLNCREVEKVNKNVSNLDQNSALQNADSSVQINIPTNYKNSNNSAYDYGGNPHPQNPVIQWNVQQFQQQFNANFELVHHIPHNQNCFHSLSNGDNDSYYSQSYFDTTTANITACNANIYLAASLPVADSSNQNPHSADVTPDTQLKTRNNSVPDILQEPTNESRNSEVLHGNYSCNTQQNEELAANIVASQNPHQMPKNSPNNKNHSSYYAMLEASTQNLAKNISSMGFPLERVAKIAQMFGADDKKIIEHLIPLSELIDLGFDESEISEALVRFDNNKDQALDYLIS